MSHFERKRAKDGALLDAVITQTLGQPLTEVGQLKTMLEKDGAMLLEKDAEIARLRAQVDRLALKVASQRKIIQGMRG